MTAKGFTLIELILVVFIIAVVTAIALPGFKTALYDLQTKDASFNISKACNYAQEMAIIEKANHKVAFDFQNGSFRVLKAELSGGKIVYRNSPGRYGRAFKIPPGISIACTAEDAVFYPDGTCDEAEIKVFNAARGLGYRLKLTGFGSRVVIEEIKR